LTGEAIAASILGKPLGDGTKQPSTGINYRPSVLRQAYLSGKVSNITGVNFFKRNGSQQIQDVIKANRVILDAAEQKYLEELELITERELLTKTDQWQAETRNSLSAGNRSWLATIAKGALTYAAYKVLRAAALGELTNLLKTDMAKMASDTFRQIQTQMSQYFQLGQTYGIDPEEWVYKIPRETACSECLRLHLNDDGSYKLYKLADVAGNINMKGSAWDFTIGPVHPHCYCILHRVVMTPPPQGPNDKFARIRAEALKPKSLQKVKTAEIKAMKKSVNPLVDNFQKSLKALLEEDPTQQE